MVVDPDVLAARWIGLPSSGGQHFLLNTGTLCVLSYYRDVLQNQVVLSDKADGLHFSRAAEGLDEKFRRRSGLLLGCNAC
jgi:hypothetical protein